MTKTAVTCVLAAGLVLTGPTSPGRAAENCKVKVLKTGQIEVSAKNVAANPKWGTSLTNITATFFNQATCYDAGALKLNKCTLGDPYTLSGITAPAGCKVCVGDDGSLDFTEAGNQKRANATDPAALTATVDNAEKLILRVECGNPAGSVVLTDARLTPA